MKRFEVLLLIPLMLLGAILIPTNVHASTGVVSVNGGTTITVGSGTSSVSVPIQVSNSNGFNGFQIIIFADPSILNAASIDLTGSVLPSPSILAECINGVLIAGTSCANQAGVAGTVELAAANNAGGSTTNPVSGTIFTINYNIVGQTGGTPISFQTGCSSTSTGNSDCVQIASGGLTVPETDMGATFINQVDFSQRATFAALSTPSGASVNDVINYNAIGPYSDVVGETVTVTPASGLSCSMVSGSVDLTASTSGSDTLHCSATANGSYSVTVSACGIFFFTCPPATPHHVMIPVLVAAPGFTLSLSQANVNISRGSSDSTTTITVTSFSGFGSLVSFTASSTQSGVTGSAPSKTPVHDASGYGTATSTLTVSVASTVPTGSYTLMVTGTGGSVTASASLTVNVPAQLYTLQSVPNSITILRGGTVATDLVLRSFGNFAGTATFAASVGPVTGQQDSCCLTNNITPFFSPATVNLSPNGVVDLTFFASTVGSSSPTTQTSTGNYTAVVTATINGVPQMVTITFTVVDFSIGPSFCTGGNLTESSESDFGALDSPQFLNDTFAGIFIGGPCSSLTITNQPNILQPFLGGNLFGEVDNAQMLWVRTNAYGGINTGLVTNGFNGTPAVAALNNQIPANGIGVPQLAVDFPVNGTKGFTWPSAACVLPTFWGNGTQIPYSYLRTHGPLIIPGTGIWAFLSTIFNRQGHPLVPPGALGNWGCKFDAGAFPNDAGTPDNNAANGVNVPRTNNPDYFGIVAMAIEGTLPGSYTFQLCGQAGVLQHCTTLGLNVVNPNVHQFVYSKTVSFSASGGVARFKLGIDNPTSFTLYVQDTVTAVGSFGDTLTAVSPVLTIGPGGAANNVFLSFQLTASMIGETFTFSQSMIVGTDPVNLNGLSSATTSTKATGTFRVTS